MIKNHVGEVVYSEEDLVEHLMRAPDLELSDVITTATLENVDELLETIPNFKVPTSSEITADEYDRRNQANWLMPEKYKQLDVAAYVIGLCKTDVELQRVGQELMLYLERDLFDLLRYLIYLVDVMRANKIIWGVGRGSSVASYVLYLVGVHRIDSIFYDLAIDEFLR